MKKNTIILIVVIVALAISGLYLGLKIMNKQETGIGQEEGLLSEEELLELEMEQMFKAAREYIKPVSAEGMEVDFEVIKQLDKWVLLRVIPLNIETDNAAIILEKDENRWEARAFGTILPGWEEKVPELFE